jgi:hypothetical protein
MPPLQLSAALSAPQVIRFRTRRNRTSAARHKAPRNPLSCAPRKRFRDCLGRPFGGSGRARATHALEQRFRGECAGDIGSPGIPAESELGTPRGVVDLAPTQRETRASYFCRGVGRFESAASWNGHPTRSPLIGPVKRGDVRTQVGRLQQKWVPGRGPASACDISVADASRIRL